MPLPIYALPDTGPDPSTTERGQGWLDAALRWIVGVLAYVPGWIWAATLGALLVATAITLPIAKRQAYKAGARTSAKSATDESPDSDKVATQAAARRDRRLLIAVLAPAFLFWMTVLVGSGRSLTAFGREDLGWGGGWDWLVPFTLDGVAVVFGALAFRAIAKQRNPDRAYRVVWIATGASASINFFHEVGGSKLGAGYLAVLSLFGMLIFHELLAQFEEGAAWIFRANPKFGLRWITWPTNTACAWVAWRNYPPDGDLDATIGNAVTHLETVRSTKTRRRADRVDEVWWLRYAPWTNVKTLRVALETERVTAAGNLAKLTANVTDLNSRLDRQAAALEQERVTAAISDRERRDENEALRQQLATLEETLTARHDEALRAQHQTLTAEKVAEVAAAKAEALLPHLADRRAKATGGRPGDASKAPSPKAVISDEAAVQKLLDHPGDPARNIPAGDLREWSQKAITEEAGVGYSRAPRILQQVTEAQRRRQAEARSGDARRDPDGDAEEHAS